MTNKVGPLYPNKAFCNRLNDNPSCSELYKEKYGPFNELDQQAKTKRLASVKGGGGGGSAVVSALVVVRLSRAPFGTLVSGITNRGNSNAVRDGGYGRW